MKIKKSWRSGAYAYFLIAPGFLLICLILIFPLVRGILSSFFAQEFNSLGLKTFVGLYHYKALFRDEVFWKTIVNTLVWVVISVTVQYLLGLLTAILLNKKFIGRGIFRSLILIPWVIPTIAGTLTWRWIYDWQYGILNYIFKTLGLSERGLNWLGSKDLALLACIITVIWKTAPFVTITLLAGLQAINRTLYEAASIDGANSFQQFWFVTLPGIKNVSVTCIILRVIWTFNQFDIVSVLTNGGPANASMILPVYTYTMAFSFNQLNYAAAVSCFGMLLILPAAVLYIWKNIKEERCVK